MSMVDHWLQALQMPCERAFWVWIPASAAEFFKRSIRKS